MLLSGMWLPQVPDEALHQRYLVHFCISPFVLCFPVVLENSTMWVQNPGRDAACRPHWPPWIDETTSYGPTSKPVPLILNMFGDGLLAYTVYSFVFVALFNNGTNTLQVGHQILIRYRPQEEPNRDLTRFMGFICLTTLTRSIICSWVCMSWRLILSGFSGWYEMSRVVPSKPWLWVSPHW